MKLRDSVATPAPLGASPTDPGAARRRRTVARIGKPRANVVQGALGARTRGDSTAPVGQGTCRVARGCCPSVNLR